MFFSHCKANSSVFDVTWRQVGLRSNYVTKFSISAPISARCKTPHQQQETESHVGFSRKLQKRKVLRTDETKMIQRNSAVHGNIFSFAPVRLEESVFVVVIG